MSPVIAMIPCNALGEITPPALSAALARLFRGLPEPGDFQGGGDEPTVLQVGAARVAIMQIDKPIPWTELSDPCETTLFWPDAAATLRAHRAHLIVTVLGVAEPVAGATLATQVAAAVVECAPSALGVYWGSASNLLRKDVFVLLAQEMHTSGPSQPIWVDVRTGPGRAFGSRGCTRGLDAFGLREFEVVEAGEPPKTLHERLVAMVHYSLANGPVIQPGHTVGRDATEKVQAIDAASTFGNPQRVLRLVFGDTREPAPPAPWWKRLLKH